MSTSFHKPIQKDTSKTISHVPFAGAGNLDDVLMISKQLNIKRISELVNEANLVEVNAEGDVWKVSSRNFQSGMVPNVEGMGLKDALPLLENNNMIVIVKGKGKVKKQSIPAGRPCKKGSEIILELSLT